MAKKGYRRGNYTADHAGTAAFLMSEELAAATEHFAEQIAARARAIAPRSNDGDGIAYADGIKVEREVLDDRIGYAVVATEGHPSLVEFGRRPGNGSPGYPGQHVMQRAAEESAI